MQCFPYTVFRVSFRHHRNHSALGRELMMCTKNRSSTTASLESISLLPSQSAFCLASPSRTTAPATDHITMYDGDTLIWGVEPDGTKPDPAVTTTTTTTEQTTTTTTRATMTTTSNGIIYESAGALLLDDEPEKLTYRVGEDLDLTGLRISLKYYYGKDSCDVIYDKVSPADFPVKFTIASSPPCSRPA